MHLKIHQAVTHGLGKQTITTSGELDLEFIFVSC